VGLVWQTHCVPTLPHGKIICVSDQSGRTGDQSGRTGTNVEVTSYLTVDEVKDKVMQTYSLSDVRHVLEQIPQFYKFTSLVFTNLDQKNAIKDDYILMGNQLKSIRDQFFSTSQDSMSKTDYDQISNTIEQLEAFQKLIQKGIQDRIYKMKDQGSRIKGMEIIGLGENDSLTKKSKNCFALF